ncbi:MAG: hypothetical protein ACRDKW_13550 [Actinomycetota bacterium]
MARGVGIGATNAHRLVSRTAKGNTYSWPYCTGCEWHSTPGRSGTREQFDRHLYELAPKRGNEGR